MTSTSSSTPDSTAWLTTVPTTHDVFRKVHDWRDQDQVHRSVMWLFPSDLPGDPAERRAASRILYRLEPAPNSAGYRVLVQAAQPPTTTGLRVTNLSPLLDALRSGMTLRFRLRTNAVECAAQSRRPVLTTAFPQWLERRLCPMLTDIHIIDTRPALYRARNQPLHTILVDGQAQIADAAQLCAGLTDGIGKAKAFGCGLLSIAPLLPG